MGWVVAFVGQKGGTGKSTLARAFAVEAARDAVAIIADLDEGQRTSTEWGERRAKAGLKPEVKVKPTNLRRAAELAEDADILVIDAPGWSDQMTLGLGRWADLLLLPTGASIDDLNPTIRLLHELTESGVPVWKLAIALCRVQSDSEMRTARGYLQAAGYEALQGALREMVSFRTVQNEGKAVTEVSFEGMNREAKELIDSIAGALAKAQEKRLELDAARKAAPELAIADRGR